jgi:hypothetical protein
MTKLDAALLKLEGALDYTVDPQVRTLIDIAQQAIEAAKQVIEKASPIEERFPNAVHPSIHLSGSMQEGVGALGGYQRAA